MVNFGAMTNPGNDDHDHGCAVPPARVQSTVARGVSDGTNGCLSS